MLTALLRRLRPEKEYVYTQFNPKLRWWADEGWLTRYQAHISTDAMVAPGADWRRILDRRYTVKEFARSVANRPGSTAECGVFRGVASAVICETLKDTYVNGARHLGFDSFEGLPEPSANDANWKRGDLKTPFEDTKARLSQFPFCELVKGWIPQCLTSHPGERFRFVHIDLDLEQPTAEAVSYFYPLLAPGGVLICDDYGFRSCPGPRIALDRFFADKPETVIDLTTGQGLVLKSS